MAQAVEGVPIDVDDDDDENANDPDACTKQSHPANTHGAKHLAEIDLPKTPDKSRIKARTQSGPEYTATREPTNQALDSRMIGSAANHDGLAPARAYWDSSDIWGTQSYRRSGRACAMCAQHIE